MGKAYISAASSQVFERVGTVGKKLAAKADDIAHTDAAKSGEQAMQTMLIVMKKMTKLACSGSVVLFSSPRARLWRALGS